MRSILIIYFVVFYMVPPSFTKGREYVKSDESVIVRMKNRAENAREGDWKTLADCANKLILRGIANGEVLSWIEKSVCMQENYYNLSLMGDYFHLKQEFYMAKLFYLKAMQMIQLKSNPEEMRRLQWKILISMGTENYYNSLASPSR